jgi:hypothetical protein
VLSEVSYKTVDRERPYYQRPIPQRQGEKLITKDLGNLLSNTDIMSFVGYGPRPRAPTITIDTSLEQDHSLASSSPTLRQTPPKLRQSASFESRESRPTSPHRISSPQHTSHPQKFLSVPVQRKRDASGVTHGVGDHPILPNKEDFVPDPGTEADFERDYKPFAFAPGHLTKLLNPKSLGAFNAMGGLRGLQAGLRTAPIFEPQISGFLSDIAVAFFPDNQSAHDIMSHDYAKCNHFKINCSDKGKLRTARGSQVNTLGTVSRTVRFAGESEEYIREFHVLPKCVHDIILGSPFLRLTQTLKKFRHRVVKKLRGMSPRHRVCLTGSSQEMLSGWANGQSILALPDTGSDICLMSLQYARERGYRVDTDPKHRQMLEFVDDSTAETFGRVEGFQWEFDRSDIQLHSPEIHVLEGLQTDLLLGYEFLEDSDAFGTHEELFINAGPHEDSAEESFGWLACAIKLASKTWDYGRDIMQKLGWKAQSRSGSGMFDWDTRGHTFSNCLTANRAQRLAEMARQETPRIDHLREKLHGRERLVRTAKIPGCARSSRDMEQVLGSTACLQQLLAMVGSNAIWACRMQLHSSRHVNS